jgi:uncharacterized protein
VSDGGAGELEVAPPSPPRWGLWAFVAVEAVFLGLSATLALLVAASGTTTAPALVVAVTVPLVAAAGLAVLITRWRGNGPRADLRLRWTGREFWLGVAFGVGGLVVTLPAAVLYTHIVGADGASAVSQLFGGLRTGWPWAVALFVVVVLVGPLCEEIIFRGLLWGALERRWGRWTALIVSTALFAVAHLEFTRTPLLLVIAIPIALARLYTGGLLASIVAHQITNLLPGLALVFALTGAAAAS